MAVVCGLACGVAAGATGRAPRATERPPDGAAALKAGGLLCVADSASFRAWWLDTPGASGAVLGADGRCDTVPPVAADTLVVAEEVRVRSIAAGFAPLIGDPAPILPRNAVLARRLRLQEPAIRARTLTNMRVATRGRLLAGFGVAQRRAVLRGLKRALVARLNREWRAAVSGRPQDFAGGTRGLDIVLDASGVTKMVSTFQPGLTPCRFTLRAGRHRFASASATILAPDAIAPRATLAHELFHGVQCNANVSGTATLLGEGTAEWHAALAEPTDFAGAAIDEPGGQRVVGGAARAISFCNDFDPARIAGLDAYASWPVWMALELGAPGTIRGVMKSALTAPPATPQAVMALLGPDRWSAAVATAAREVCGNLRSPSGATIFPQAIEGYFGALRPSATPGPPSQLTLAAGGVASIVATWSPSTMVTLRVSPPALADRLFVRSGGALLSVTADSSAAVVSVPAGLVPQGGASLTLANPSAVSPTTATVEVLSS